MTDDDPSWDPATIFARQTPLTPDEQLIRRIDSVLDNTFIWIGKTGKDHDYRLHPMFAKDMHDVRNQLIKAFKEHET